MDLIAAMKQRRSARAFLKNPVSRAQVEEILECAGLAPSAINLQPWEFVVTHGEEKDRLIRRLLKAHGEQKVPCGPGTATPLPERYTNRSRGASQGLKPHLAAMGIEFNRFIEEGSCSFYGAPIAIIVTMNKLFPRLRYLDVGLGVSYLLLAAEAKGLATCPIGLITAYANDIAEVLNIPKEKEILLAIALGYADEASPLNRYKTEREPLEEIRSWYE
ncbi:MAG: nitroreductase [Pseudomonadota bacterium]